MKVLISSLLALSVVFSAGAEAKVKDLSKVMAKATAKEKRDLIKLLDQISMVPIEDPKTGEMVFKVTKVQKGSVYDREGIKVGDLISK